MIPRHTSTGAASASCESGRAPRESLTVDASRIFGACALVQGCHAVAGWWQMKKHGRLPKRQKTIISPRCGECKMPLIISARGPGAACTPTVAVDRLRAFGNVRSAALEEPFLRRAKFTSHGVRVIRFQWVQGPCRVPAAFLHKRLG